MIIMIVGGILVAGLVVWALTRSVEPAVVTPATTETVPATPPASPVTITPGQTATNTTTLTPGSFSIPPGGQPQQPPKDDGVARTSVEDLHGQFTRGAVTILDVRDATSYENGHIPGAINVPMASVQSYLDTIPKDKPIVAYCT